jgi:hypothetical protein
MLLLAAPPSLRAGTLRALTVRASEENAEFRLQTRARAAGTSWDTPGRESAALRVLVDGRCDQYIFLSRGPETAVYETIIGPLSRGAHQVSLEWEQSWTPKFETPPEVFGLEAIGIERTGPDSEAVLRAPIIYLRPDTIGRFSDVPLLLYWDPEAGDLSSDQTTYTVIFTNEDGGTNTERLMARWGRTSDIEWCYAWTGAGNSVREAYQGRDHETKQFAGRKEGSHPLLYDATTNNVFADEPVAGAGPRVRPFPVRAGLLGRARETVMDRHPWLYAITSAEMRREGKFENPPDPLTPAVSDLSNYAGIEVCSEQRGTEFHVELALEGDSRAYTSHHGDPKSRIGRSGCVRTTVELPPGTAGGRVRSVTVSAVHAPAAPGHKPDPNAAARFTAIPRLFLFGRDCAPGPDLLSRRFDRTLRPGESFTLPVGQ